MCGLNWFGWQLYFFVLFCSVYAENQSLKDFQGLLFYLHFCARLKYSCTNYNALFQDKTVNIWLYTLREWISIMQRSALCWVKQGPCQSGMWVCRVSSMKTIPVSFRVRYNQTDNQWAKEDTCPWWMEPWCGDARQVVENSYPGIQIMQQYRWCAIHIYYSHNTILPKGHMACSERATYYTAQRTIRVTHEELYCNVCIYTLCGN